MGVHTLVTTGSDVSVAPPAPGEVAVGNAAGAWQGRPLDDPTAFPLIAELRHAIASLNERLDALEAVLKE